MGILGWIVLGLIAGALAKLLMPGKDPGGCIITIVIGVVGALLGGFIATSLDYGGIQEFNLWSLVIATLGSIILLAIYRLIKSK